MRGRILAGAFCAGLIGAANLMAGAYLVSAPLLAVGAILLVTAALLADFAHSGDDNDHHDNERNK